ncbi:MAG: four helix bundle protein [Saprospiraceae bacterium]|nr:four helix bundle protein [Saprospiraceae bacterium]
MMTEVDQNNPIVRHSFEFALMIESFCSECRDKQKFDRARQLFRAGTSIGANVWEAQDPESRADFIHKMKIAAKEARETQFWLLICQYSPGYPSTEPILQKLSEIRKLLNAIIHSAKRHSPYTRLLSFLGIL